MRVAIADPNPGHIHGVLKILHKSPIAAVKGSSINDLQILCVLNFEICLIYLSIGSLDNVLGQPLLPLVLCPPRAHVLDNTIVNHSWSDVDANQPVHLCDNLYIVGDCVA